MFFSSMSCITSLSENHTVTFGTRRKHYVIDHKHNEFISRVYYENAIYSIREVRERFVHAVTFPFNSCT